MSELQAIAGVADDDKADQFLISTSEPGARAFLESIYPKTEVIERTSLVPRQLFDSKLPMALSIGAAITSFVIGILFVMTTIGLKIAGERETFAILSVVGVSSRTESLLVIIQTMLLTLIGAMIGLVLGFGGVMLINRFVSYWFEIDRIAVTQPAFGAYGIILAIVIGFMAVPYLLIVTHRTSLITELTR